MSWWSRIANVFRSGHLNREIDEEFASHFEEAVASGRDPEEVRRAFGSALRQREASRDVRLAAWLDSLRADSTFAWRQLQRHKIASAAAIVSLALAIGACTTAFRLIDALLLCGLLLAYEPYKRRDGELTALLLTLHPISRFLLEIIRIDESAVFGTGMSISQNISIGIFLIGVGLWVYLFTSRPPGIAWQPRLAVAA